MLQCLALRGEMCKRENIGNMKILAIYFRSGSGISVIYERIFCHLAKHATVDVLSDMALHDELEGVRKVYSVPMSRRMQSYYRKFLRNFGAVPISKWWSRKAEKVVAKDYDIVIAFMASSQLTPAVCGSYIAEKLGCKFAIYSVDAIPGPGGWTKPREFRGKMRVVGKYFAKADYVASSNKHMLEFQLSTFKHKQGLRSNVLLTPSPDKVYNLPVSSEKLILYTGSLYGLRNPNYLFKAFKRLLVKYPDARLMMVGIKLKLRDMNTILTPEELRSVTIAEHTNDLVPLFERARVLLDIDADREKDPFLSSKIITYLKTNRMIVCETGRITPSREMFAGYNTIIQCDHNEDSLYEGLVRAIEMGAVEQDYSEREPVIKAFSIEEVGGIFWRDLQELVR